MTPDEARSLPIADLELSVRVSNLLRRQWNVATVGDLCRLCADELLYLRCFGQTCLQEVEEKLAALGLQLRSEAQPWAHPAHEFGERHRAFLHAPSRNLDSPVAVLDLCSRAVWILRSAGILTVAELLALVESEAWPIHGLDEEAREDVMIRLGFHGLLTSGGARL